MPYVKIILPFLVMGNQQGCSPCKHGWIPFSIQGTEQCFKYIGKRSILFAESDCSTLNGFLPVPENYQQNKDYFNAFVKVKGYDHHVALGINDVENEGEFIRATGEKVKYFNWFSGEPNNWNNNEHYVGKFS